MNGAVNLLAERHVAAASDVLLHDSFVGDPGLQSVTTPTPTRP